MSKPDETHDAPTRAGTAGKPGFSIWMRGVLGAIVGGAIGYGVFVLALHYGIHVLVLPGALVGLGRVTAARGKSIPLGVVCGVLGMAAGLFAQWRFSPVGYGFFYPLIHIGELPLRMTLSIVAGGGIAAWFGMGRSSQP